MNIVIGKELNGKTFKQMLVYGAASLRKNMEIVNNLNVFPVPDGDTGTNMKMTFESGLNNLDWESVESIGSVSQKFASGMLLGARGNSGVILSQIFKGISNGLENKETINCKELEEAFKQGVTQSYKAVKDPVEGTILTVFREATEKASTIINDEITIDEYLKNFISYGEETLESTPDLLPILKEAKVVDSGGAGLIYIFRGMIGEVEESDLRTHKEEVTKKNVLKRIEFNENGELDYAYCTEFLLQLQPKKTNIETFDVQVIVNELEKINGNSIVAIKDQDIVKVHVHVDRPGLVYEIAQRYGEFISLKCENMAIQHSETTIENNYHQGDSKADGKTERKNMALITVAKDEGFKELFLEMGADYIVDGGQSMNPSSDDFIKAFKTVNADNIIVLPNNSNIFLAASQAKEIYKDANVYIVPTKSLGEGYSSLSVYNSCGSVDENLESLEEQEKNTFTIDVTKAVRNACLNGVNINKDDYIALSGKKVLSSNDNCFDTISESLSYVIDQYDCSIITVFMGLDTTEDCENNIRNFIENKYNEVEIYFIYTNQETYNYIFVLE